MVQYTFLTIEIDITLISGVSAHFRDHVRISAFSALALDQGKLGPTLSSYFAFKGQPKSNLKFLGSLGPLIHGKLLAKSISQLPECPNQLAYSTIISFLVSKFSFSVKSSKISQLETKLWPPKVELKIFWNYKVS